MLTKAYTPEQSAFGQLENGRDVVILYVKEFSEAVKNINSAGLSSFSYDWFAAENKKSYVLKITYPNEVFINIRFDQPHFKLLAQLIEPKDVILTTTPISDLMAMAQISGFNFLEFDEVLTFSNLSFSDQETPQNIN